MMTEEQLADIEQEVECLAKRIPPKVSPEGMLLLVKEVRRLRDALTAIDAICNSAGEYSINVPAVLGVIADRAREALK